MGRTRRSCRRSAAGEAGACREPVLVVLGLGSTWHGVVGAWLCTSMGVHQCKLLPCRHVNPPHLQLHFSLYPHVLQTRSWLSLDACSFCTRGPALLLVPPRMPGRPRPHDRVHPMHHTEAPFPCCSPAGCRKSGQQGSGLHLLLQGPSCGVFGSNGSRCLEAGAGAGRIGPPAARRKAAEGR